VQAVIVPVNGLLFSEGMQIARLALAARLPTVAADRKYVEAGLLASYGIDQRESYRHAASYVDRILKGAKPGDLPIEFPTRIELTINLKTAKALGLDLPPSLVTRADEASETASSSRFSAVLSYWLKVREFPSATLRFRTIQV